MAKGQQDTWNRCTLQTWIAATHQIGHTEVCPLLALLGKI